MEKKVVRFEIQDLLPIGLTLVVAGIGLVYGLSVMSDIGDDYCGDESNEYLVGETCHICPNSSHSVFIARGVCANESQSAAMSNVSSGVNGGADWNASKQAILGVAKIPEKMPLIATVIVAAVIIGILVRYLMVRFA